MFHITPEVVQATLERKGRWARSQPANPRIGCGLGMASLTAICSSRGESGDAQGVAGASFVSIEVRAPDRWRASATGLAIAARLSGDQALAADLRFLRRSHPPNRIRPLP